MIIAVTVVISIIYLYCYKMCLCVFSVFGWVVYVWLYLFMYFFKSQFFFYSFPSPHSSHLLLWFSLIYSSFYNMMPLFGRWAYSSGVLVGTIWQRRPTFSTGAWWNHSARDAGWSSGGWVSGCHNMWCSRHQFKHTHYWQFQQSWWFIDLFSGNIHFLELNWNCIGMLAYMSNTWVVL